MLRESIKREKISPQGLALRPNLFGSFNVQLEKLKNGQVSHKNLVFLKVCPHITMSHMAVFGGNPTLCLALHPEGSTHCSLGL